MLKQIGYFHFGCSDTDPLRRLTDCLEAKQSTEGSLLVLPEAFNVENFWEAGLPKFSKGSDTEFLQCLTQIAVDWKISFVVGILNRDTFHNVSYLVTGNGDPVLLSNKLGASDKERGKSAEEDPIVRSANLHGWSIFSLICLDASGNSAQREKTAEKIQAAGWNDDADHKRIMCVPARMSATNTKALADKWSNCVFALANGHYALDSPSIVKSSMTKEIQPPARIEYCDIAFIALPS